MKVFDAQYHRSGSYGFYDDRYAVIVANTESEALGFALESHSDTVACHWTIVEVDTTTPGCLDLVSQSS